MKSNKKVPVVNNINALNAEVAYLRRKVRQKHTPDPPTPDSNANNLYEISFMYDETHDTIQDEWKDKFGFKITTELVEQTVYIPKTIVSLVYYDGDTMEEITPPLYSYAVEHIYKPLPERPQEYNMYMFVPYQSNGPDYSISNIWVGVRTLQINNRFGAFPMHAVEEKQFDGKTKYFNDF